MLDNQDLDYGIEAFTDRLVNEAGEMVTEALARYFKHGGTPMSEQEITDVCIYQLSGIGRRFKEEVDRRLAQMADDGIVSSTRN